MFYFLGARDMFARREGSSKKGKSDTYSREYVKRLENKLQEKNNKLIEIEKRLDSISNMISQIKKDNQDLRFQKNIFNVIFNNLEEKMIVVNENGKIENMNNAALNFFNLTRNDLNKLKLSEIITDGQIINDIKHTHKSSGRFYNKLFNETINLFSKKVKVDEKDLIFLQIK